MALPDDTNPAPAAETATEPADAGVRHLHAVPDETAAETTGELPRIIDAPADTDTTAPADAADHGQVVGAAEGAAEVAEPPAWAAWLGTAFTPQSGLYTERPLSASEVLRRAKHGQQLADSGPLRMASIAGSWMQAAGKLTLRTIEWLLFEHAARTFLVAALLGLAWLVISLAV